MTIPKLSKSRFLAGLQCPLRLWNESFHPELASETTPVQQAIFDQGHLVGAMATRLYPGGLLIREDHLHHEEAVESTRKAMADPAVRAIYEAAFMEDDVRIRVDVLERAGDGGWNLVEVKSSTSVKDVHLPDTAIQEHVLGEAGLEVDRVILMHINNRYVLKGDDPDLEWFFKQTDLTDRSRAYRENLPGLLEGFQAMLGKTDPPDIQPSRHCKRPYECAFWAHCTREMPEHWIMELPGISESRFQALSGRGVTRIADIPASFPLSDLQRRVRGCVVHDREYCSRGLVTALQDVEYPVHFLDFETAGPAVPRYVGTRPYQAIPFQWSDHILKADGTLAHRAYLCCEDRDPRESFTETLLDALGDTGSIVVYTTYERVVVRGLMTHLPQHRDRLMRLLPRFKDLYAIIRKHYYHPAFHGSFSLKSVLPALAPEMTYGDLAVQEGATASLAYLRMLEPSTPHDERENIKRDLLDYCAQDTLAMVKIREALLRK